MISQLELDALAEGNSLQDFDRCFAVLSENTEVSEVAQLLTPSQFPRYLEKIFSEYDGSNCDIAAYFNLSATLLEFFIHTNYTGPSYPFEKVEDIKIKVEDFGEKYYQTLGFMVPNGDRKNFEAIWREELVNEAGEDIYDNCRCLSALAISKNILQALVSLEDCFLQTKFWQLSKAHFLHQRVSDNPSEALQNAIYINLSKQDVFMKDIEKNVKGKDAPNCSVLHLLARFYLFNGLVNHYYHEIRSTKDFMQKAQELTGLEWDVTGALGKRTKFQEKDTAQLVLRAQSDKNLSAFLSDYYKHPIEIASKNLPEALDLKDDTLLEEISFKESENSISESVSILDQYILLGFCMNVKNSNPDHGLTQEQMMPFVVFLIKNSKHYLVKSMALLLRSRLESQKTRTVERSLFQLQVLVDQFSNSYLEENVETIGSSRSVGFWDMIFPACWELRKEFGESLVSLGALKSAAEVFESIQMWEEVVHCYVLMEENVKAENLVKKLLADHPDSPKLLCILGDIKQDPKIWEKAWNVSGNRYARAMRSLGNYYFKNQIYRESVEAFQKALSINSLFENTWFSLGCAAMQIEDWEESQRAFMRCIMLNSVNGEAWNNLAAIHLRMKRKQDAFRCFREAIKEKYDNWKIWENYLLLSLDLGEFSEAIRAYDRLLDIKWTSGKTAPDTELLKVLVDGSRHLVDTLKQDLSVKNQSQIKFSLESSLESLLKKVVSIHSLNAECWDIFSDHQSLLKKHESVINGRISAYRAVQQSIIGETAADDLESFKKLANYALKLAREYYTQYASGISQDGLFQAKLILRNLIKKTKDSFEEEPLHIEMRDLLDEIRTIAGFK